MILECFDNDLRFLGCVRADCTWSATVALGVTVNCAVRSTLVRRAARALGATSVDRWQYRVPHPVAYDPNHAFIATAADLEQYARESKRRGDRYAYYSLARGCRATDLLSEKELFNDLRKRGRVLEAIRRVCDLLAEAGADPLSKVAKQLGLPMNAGRIETGLWLYRTEDREWDSDRPPHSVRAELRGTHVEAYRICVGITDGCPFTTYVEEDD